MYVRMEATEFAAGFAVSWMTLHSSLLPFYCHLVILFIPSAVMVTHNAVVDRLTDMYFSSFVCIRCIITGLVSALLPGGRELNSSRGSNGEIEFQHCH